MSEWRDCPGFNGRYQVSDDGEVRSTAFVNGHSFVPRMKMKSLNKLRNGYLSVLLARDGTYKHYAVHRLVLEAFVGQCPVGHEGAHQNGNRADNRLENLAWLTKRQNHAQKVLHGTAQRGENNPVSRFNEADVRSIRRLREQGHTLQSIADRFNCNQATISKIALRKSWSHI